MLAARLVEAPSIFEALIVPHRSLGARGLYWVAGFLAVFATVVGVRFALLGAWPVLPFSLAEIGLVIAMLRFNARHARTSELVLLTGQVLRIVRTDSKGRRAETILPAGWLSVSLEERTGRVPRLLLLRHGKAEEIAAALGEAEKRDLAYCLAQALHRGRNPVFDNPQLRP